MSDNSAQTPINPPNTVNPDGVPKTCLCAQKADLRVVKAWKKILEELEADKENIPPEVYDLEKAHAERNIAEEARYYDYLHQHYYRRSLSTAGSGPPVYSG